MTHRRLPLLLLVWMSSADCAGASPRAPMPPAQPMVAPCLVEPPPQLHPFRTARADCAPSLVCFDKLDAIAVVANLEALRRYAIEAWLYCGVRPAVGASSFAPDGASGGAPPAADAGAGG